MEKVRHTLHRPELRKLEDFVLANWEDIKKYRWSKKQFAEMASKKLGFVVNDNNVRGAAKAVNLVWLDSKTNSLISTKIPKVVFDESFKLLTELAGSLGQNIPANLKAYVESLD